MPNIYLDYSLKRINSKPTKGKAPQFEGTFVKREFSLKIGTKNNRYYFIIFARIHMHPPKVSITIVCLYPLFLLLHSITI